MYSVPSTAELFRSVSGNVCTAPNVSCPNSNSCSSTSMLGTTACAEIGSRIVLPPRISTFTTLSRTCGCSSVTDMVISAVLPIGTLPLCGCMVTPSISLSTKNTALVPPSFFRVAVFSTVFPTLSTPKSSFFCANTAKPSWQPPLHAIVWSYPSSVFSVSTVSAFVVFGKGVYEIDTAMFEYGFTTPRSGVTANAEPDCSCHWKRAAAFPGFSNTMVSVKVRSSASPKLNTSSAAGSSSVTGVTSPRSCSFCWWKPLMV
mmetsp:Transcript_3653/g.8715  ORF Transcript_3653/g.8715 Transcript_3653/m.8715 type:complete len:259 (+) Transcript_3653:6505-7281(+)